MTVAAIIAAYNEAPTIGAIVKTLVDSKLFRDVIVISDGSTDRTADVARENGASLVHQFPWNHGKGSAMMHGVAHTDADFLFFCDADLRGLRVDHVRAVLQPVLDGKLAMCVGLRDRGFLLTKLSRYLPLIGGERALQRHIFEDVRDTYLQGYMAESALNYYCSIRNLPYGSVELPGLTMRRKIQKLGVAKGLRGYVRMSWQIFKGMMLVRRDHARGQF